MAIYFTLAIHCADNTQTAEYLASRFEQLRLEVPDGADVTTIHCTASAYKTSLKTVGKQWEMVCVTQPVYFGGPRDDLISNNAFQAIRTQLLGVLRGTHADAAGTTEVSAGYMAALFGLEAQETLGESDWLERLETLLKTSDPHRCFNGIVLTNQHFLDSQCELERLLSPFCKGYVWLDRPVASLNGRQGFGNQLGS